MAVLAEFAAPEATGEQIYALEELTVARGDAAGKPPLEGLMFLAVVPDGPGFRFVTAWRREDDFRAAMRDIMEPDAAQVGLTFTEAVVTTVVGMAMPSAHG